MIEDVKKARFTLAGGLIYQFTLGSVFSLGNFSIYFLTYFDNKPSLQLGYFTMVFCYLFQWICNPMGDFISYKFGVHAALGIGSFLLISASAIFYYVTSHVLTLFMVMGLYGIGLGICYTPLIKNTCLFYPNYQGRIGLLMISAGELGKALYCFIAESLINPNNQDFQLGKEITSEVALNFKYYLIFMFIWITMMTVVSCIMIYQYIPNKDDELLQDPINNNPVASLSLKSNKLLIRNVQKIFASCRFYYYFFLNFFILYLYLNVEHTYKIIEIYQFHTSLQQIKYLTLINYLCATISGPIWGLLYEVIQFKWNICIISLCGALISVGIFGMIAWVSSSGVMIIINSISFTAASTMINLHMIKVFSFKYSFHARGAINIGSSFAIGISSFVTLLMYSNKFWVKYLIGYSLGGILSLIGFVMIFSDKDKEFEYFLTVTDIGIIDTNSSPDTN